MQETPKSSIWLRFTAEPRTGRFITRDSYRGERENADTWHLYAYCANNPINYVDPSGHFALPLAVGVVLVVGLIITYSYIEGSISVNNDVIKKFDFKFNKKKHNHYRVMVQFHGPAKYKGKTGIAAMKARWKITKGSKRKKIVEFVKKHNYRYHMHVRIIKNGKMWKEFTL